MSLSRNNLNRQKGISLLEVLISLVIVSTSMLAVALYSLTGLQENQTGYLRSQANLIAYDMADRIRANAAYAMLNTTNYEITTNADGDVPSAPTGADCRAAAAGCSDQDLATHDLREWAEYFTDVTGVGADGANYEALIPDAFGDVTFNSQDDVVITITWDDTSWDTTGGGNRGDSTSQLQLELRITD